jgi:exosome complex component CSL4
MMKSKKEKNALPGDVLAVPEEFLPGENTYSDDVAIRALLVGTVTPDTVKREIHLRPVKRARPPTVGDIVVGQVESAQTNSANMRIHYINGKATAAGFSGMFLLKSESPGRGPRHRALLKLGDIVRARVSSTLNAIIQLSLDCENCGVVFALCSNCGSPLTGGDRRVRCLECGSVEDRQYAPDFGKVIHP